MKKIRGYRNIIVALLSIALMNGCFLKSEKISQQQENNAIRANIIAVLPIGHHESEEKAAELFRSRLLEELYFKGYPKVNFEDIDALLASGGEIEGNIPSSVDIRLRLTQALGADAFMYCSLSEDKKTKIFYAPIKINVACELVSTGTGDSIWKEQTHATKRSFDLTQKGLERKSYEDFEPVIDEVVSSIIKTLPDGPNFQ